MNDKQYIRMAQWGATIGVWLCILGVAYLIYIM
jgi:hypothetical protein